MEPQAKTFGTWTMAMLCEPVGAFRWGRAVAPAYTGDSHPLR